MKNKQNTNNCDDDDYDHDIYIYILRWRKDTATGILEEAVLGDNEGGGLPLEDFFLWVLGSSALGLLEVEFLLYV